METEAYEGVTTWMLLRDPFWRKKTVSTCNSILARKERLSATRTSKAHLMKTRELSLIIPQFGTHGPKTDLTAFIFPLWQRARQRVRREGVIAGCGG